MGRIRQMINVHGRESWTLFDTGARNTYVVPAVASILTTSELSHPFRTALGGAVQETTKIALLEAEVEGLPMSTHAMVIDHIGQDDDGKSIEILFGALAMQQWRIRLIPEKENSISLITPGSLLSSNPLERRHLCLHVIAPEEAGEDACAPTATLPKPSRWVAKQNPRSTHVAIRDGFLCPKHRLS